MNKTTLTIGSIVIFILIIALISAAFVVTEPQQVIITQFGKPIGKPITKPGLYFKVPFLQEANFFDKRFHFCRRARAEIY